MPRDTVSTDTLLVFISALELDAPWACPFFSDPSDKADFFVSGTDPFKVPTMSSQGIEYDYANREGYQAVYLPYFNRSLGFLILVPNERAGLAELEAKLSPTTFSDIFAQVERERELRGGSCEVELYLPRFKITPQTVGMPESIDGLRLVPELVAGGIPASALLKPAFLHSATITVNEWGTQASAFAGSSTAFGLPATKATVRADHPFVFAVIHCDGTPESATCLFLGRLTDPR